jgi:hypothetical protein
MGSACSSCRATSCTLAAMVSDTSRTQPSSTFSAKTRTGRLYCPVGDCARWWTSGRNAGLVRSQGIRGHDTILCVDWVRYCVLCRESALSFLPVCTRKLITVRLGPYVSGVHKPFLQRMQKRASIHHNYQAFAERSVFSLRACRRVCRRVGNRREEAQRNRSLRCFRETMPHAPHLPV